VDDELLLRIGDLQARISRLGAELASLQWGSLNVLWRPDREVWSGTCPVLFPVIGRARNDQIQVDGQSFHMPMHGFAAGHVFDVVEADTRSCCLELRDTATTRLQFPYAFHLTIRFRLNPNGLTIDTRIANPGVRSLPASFGLHPGFSWPLIPGTDKQDYSIQFSDDDHLVYTRPVDRLLGPWRGTLVAEGGKLQLTEDLFRDGGLLFLAPCSRQLSYGRNGGPTITLEFRDFPQLLLWMRPGSDFLCIEPCRGHADPLEFADDFSRKPGAMLIEPNRAASLSLRITIDRC
jgi:galactose mutarotase-like enzyme